MDPIQSFQARLALLDSMLSKLKSSHSRVQQLKRSVHVLRTILKDQANIKSPYGPETPMARFFVQ